MLPPSRIPAYSANCNTPAPRMTTVRLGGRGLAELVPPEELAKGFTPAHEETRVVPDKWNMVKVKPWAKYGTAVALIIEGAAIPGTPRLVIKQKEAKP